MTSKFSGSPVLGGHLTQDEQAAAFGVCWMTIKRWTELRVDPLPYIEMPNGSKLFKIMKSQQWLARRERAALPVPRRRKTAVPA